MSGQVSSKKFLVASQHGFHLRPITLLVQLSGRFDATITVSKDGNEVGTGSVMELLLLGARQGDMLEVKAAGADCGEALAAVEDLFKELAEGDD